MSGEQVLPPDEPGDAERAGSGALAALGYCSVLLVCWILSAELFHLILGERPRWILVGAQFLGLLLPALALTRLFALSGFEPRTSRRPAPKRSALLVALPGLAVSGYLVALSLNVAWLGCLKSTGWTWVSSLESLFAERYRELLIANDGPELLAVLLMVSLVPAICEEVAFRRGLQGLLASRTGGATAVVVTAAIFAAFHLEPFGLPTRFFLGLSLGIVYHRTGSLWAAGLLHAAHNLAAVGGLQLAEAARGNGEPVLSELEGVPIGPVTVMGALGLVGWVVSLQMLRAPGDGDLEESSS